ncbi:MAG: dienelactone hydrolase family protein [Gaiellaceae bacterium]
MRFSKRTATRWPFWCSAVLLLAACGGGGDSRDPFAYDPTTPLAPSPSVVYATAPWATIRSFTFAGAGGSRVEAYIVVPRAGGRKPGVLFLHGSGGTRLDLLGQAAVLAKHGAVTLTITYPSDTATYRPLIVDARRALDLLEARSDVDAARLGVVGFSLGAQIAAIVAGDDPRPKAVDVVGGRGNAVTTYWVARAQARLFFQAGTHDEVVPHAQLLALMRAAPGRPRIQWYPVGHLLSKQIDEDLVAWMAHTLG